MMHQRPFLTAVLALILFTSSCVQVQDKTSEEGFLEGKVSIGPLCPVEGIPQDPRCQPTEATYKAWPLAVYTLDKRTKVTSFTPQGDGRYRIALPQGAYLIDLEKERAYVGKSNLPARVTITVGATTKLDIMIDTGIR